MDVKRGALGRQPYINSHTCAILRLSVFIQVFGYCIRLISVLLHLFATIFGQLFLYFYFRIFIFIFFFFISVCESWINLLFLKCSLWTLQQLKSGICTEITSVFPFSGHPTSTLKCRLRGASIKSPGPVP